MPTRHAAPGAQRPLSLLFSTWEGGGTLPPVLAVAEKMLARGHAVRILAEDCQRADCEAAGATFIGWARAPNRPDRSRGTDPLRDWEAKSPPEAIGRMVARVMAGPALAYAQDLVQELAQRPADLVVTSDMLMGVLAGCERLGQPAAVLSTNICIFPLPGSPPFGGGLAPPRDAEEERVLAEVRAGVGQLLDTGLPALNAARAELGLKPLEHVAGQFKAARAPLLLATSEAFDFPWRDRPDWVRYVGPQISDPPAAPAWISPWGQDARPLVLVGFSTSFQDHVGVLQRVLDALAGLPVRVLLTTGETIDPGELVPGPNAVVVRQAPHVAVMAEAALVITHGGHGTLIRALAQGLPSLILPHGRDQEDNARRVTERGAGLRLPAQAAVEEIAAAVHRLLAEPAFAEAASRLGLRVRAEAEASPIVELLEAQARALAPA
ncbi:MAG TPA: glycosyltransferase [Phenylobacterium sp.]|uniref:glycosyltransferase n=1 Tax=Phenylobacterium sp. TaxID=1871053 RepID=UPI002B485976|nr:glycosyltransferase [Phenylobacterium sp.]HKR87752.1 glycosyltransferase [Phenylobacterium sp.]